MEVPLAELMAAAAAVAGCGEELAAAQAAVAGRLAACEAGWQGHSAVALERLTAGWAADTAAVLSRLGECAGALEAAAQGFSAMEQAHAAGLR